MQFNSVMKVPGGKLVKISLEAENGRIKCIEITGDFFAHPEDIIEKIEQRIVGKKIDEDVLAGEIKKVIEENNAKLFGIDAENIAKAIMMCTESKK